MSCSEVTSVSSGRTESQRRCERLGSCATGAAHGTMGKSGTLIIGFVHCHHQTTKFSRRQIRRRRRMAAAALSAADGLAADHDRTDGVRCARFDLPWRAAGRPRADSAPARRRARDRRRVGAPESTRRRGHAGQDRAHRVGSNRRVRLPHTVLPEQPRTRGDTDRRHRIAAVLRGLDCSICRIPAAFGARLRTT